MGNTISLHSCQSNTDEWLYMPNGGTSVFLATLVLSGSAIANSSKEKDLIIWLAEHDQTVMGLGAVGFDIADIPWDEEKFVEERDYLLAVVDGALKKTGWDTLSYEPTEERVFSYLQAIRRMITDFDPSYIDKTAYPEWIEVNDALEYHLPDGYPNCSNREKWLGQHAISDHQNLVAKFKEYLDDDEYLRWAVMQTFPKIKKPDGYPMCRKHNALLYWHGCIICNDIVYD